MEPNEMKPIITLTYQHNRWVPIAMDGRPLAIKDMAFDNTGITLHLEAADESHKPPEALIGVGGHNGQPVMVWPDNEGDDE